MTSLLDERFSRMESAIELCSSAQSDFHLMASHLTLDPKLRRVSPETLVRAVTRSAQAGLPKHIQLGNAIIDLINADPELVRREIEEVIGISAADAILTSARATW